MSATSGTGEPRTISPSAAAASASGTASRTTSAPAPASARTWSSVAATSAVRVQVIDWTAIGAPPPMATPPIRTWRVGRRSPSVLELPSPCAAIVRVLTARRRRAGPSLLDPQLLVDDRLEGLEGLGAAQQPAVDEEGRRPGHARLVPRL